MGKKDFVRYIHTYIHIHSHTYIHIHTYIHTHIHICTYTHPPYLGSVRERSEVAITNRGSGDDRYIAAYEKRKAIS